MSCHSRLPLYENGFLPNESWHQPVREKRHLQSNVYITYSCQSKFLNYVWAVVFKSKDALWLLPDGMRVPVCSGLIVTMTMASFTVWLSNGIDGYSLLSLPLHKMGILHSLSQDTENWYRLDLEVKSHNFDLRYGMRALVFHLIHGSCCRPEWRMASGNVSVVFGTLTFGHWGPKR